MPTSTAVVVTTIPQSGQTGGLNYSWILYRTRRLASTSATAWFNSACLLHERNYRNWANPSPSDSLTPYPWSSSIEKAKQPWSNRAKQKQQTKSALKFSREQNTNKIHLQAEKWKTQIGHDDTLKKTLSIQHETKLDIQNLKIRLLANTSQAF